jgi:two-component system sensor histidine kinase KdpD
MTISRDPEGAPLREWVLWGLIGLAATAVLFAYRSEIGGAHVALAYLLVVLGASARGGRRLGFVLAVLSFVAFNFLFIPPYYTLIIHRQLDWLVLFAFLVTSAVATQLLHRAQSEAAAARSRSLEVERLASLGAETLNAARAEDSVVAIAKVIQSGLGVLSCDIYLRGDSAPGIRRIARATAAVEGLPSPRDPSPRALGRAAAGLAISELADGRNRFARTPDMQSTLALLLAQQPRAVLIPLRVKGEPVGVLRLEGDPAVTLDADQCRFAEALAYYAALALERVDLAAEAARADSLREADRLKDSLLASVSHDLRTPLTTIKALSHAIAAEGDQRARIVEEEADRLNGFVSDLLDLSRLNAGAVSATAEIVAAEDVLGAALQQVSGSVNGREVLASVEAGGSLLVGRFDFVHTLRALVNLIGNALKYSAPDGVVEVTARRDNGRVVFEVADDGPGIPEEDRERIFEPFIRGRAAAAGGGSGLGLTIARRMVELQGGRLDYAPRFGGGSVFAISLPGIGEEELAQISL